MVSYSDQGIVLHSFNFGEYDKIYELFTKEHGKIKVIAKGVRKVRSHHQGNLLLFDLVQVQLAQGKNFEILQYSKNLSSLHKKFLSNYECFQIGALILQLTSLCNQQYKVKNTQQFDLLLAALENYNENIELNNFLAIYLNHLSIIHGFGVDFSEMNYLEIKDTLEELFEKQFEILDTISQNREVDFW